MRLRYAIGPLVGAGVGYLFYRFVGCSTGTCPLVSNPWITMGYGAVVGLLVVRPGPANTEDDRHRDSRSGEDQPLSASSPENGAQASRSRKQRELEGEQE